MKFFRSLHVLVLFGVILAVEVVIRMGTYEPVVKPLSHPGTTITLKRALSGIGRENVDLLTFGSSRANQGLDNLRIYHAARERGLNHVRASMPGSHFLTFKALADWSLEELPGLQGIMLAVSAEAFMLPGNGAYETGKVLPIRNHVSSKEILHHVPLDRADFRTFTPFYTANGYREDLKALLADPIGRLELVRERNASDPLGFLTSSNRDERDICVISTSDPQACLDELGQRGEAIPAPTREALQTLCKVAMSKRQFPPPGAAEKQLAAEWTEFLLGLSGQVRILLVILPDHSIFQRHISKTGAAYVEQQILQAAQTSANIDVLDVREVIVAGQEQECSYYMDHRHLNQRGKDALTKTVLPELEKFWAKLPGDT